MHYKEFREYIATTTANFVTAGFITTTQSAAINVKARKVSSIDVQSNILVELLSYQTLAALTTSLAESATFTGIARSVAAVTATADGLTTGIIPDGTTLAVVTSASANNIAVLPTPTPGTKITIHVGANGCELRSSAPATVAINGGTGAGAESAIGANTTVYAECVTATVWKAFQQAAAGTLVLTEVAA